MPHTKNNILLMMIYYVFTVLIFYFFDGGVKIGSFTVMYRYIFAAVLILIGFFCFLIEWDTSVITVLKDAAVHILPYALALCVSSVIWVFRRPSLTTITRGGFYVVYIFIALLLAVSYVIVFGRRSIYILMCSMVTAYIIVIYRYGIQSQGVAAFIHNFINQIVTFGEEKNSFAKVEDADIQFAFGCLLIFFALDNQENVPRRILCVFISLLFFMVGFKRITVFGVAAALCLAFAVRRKKGEHDVLIVRILAIVLIAVLAGYVIMGKLNILETIYDYYDIETKGRTDFMAFIDKYYYLSPTFLGYGLGYVNRLMEVLYEAGRIDAAVLHNDILRLYVELGFWGFAVWVISYWFVRFDYFIKHRDKRVFKIVLAVVIYLTVTFLTDNTVYYFNINFAAFLVMLAAEYPLSKQAAALKRQNVS